MSEPLRPQRNRIPALDIARAFALLGVVVMNMHDYRGPLAGAGVHPGKLDHVVEIVQTTLWEAKSACLLALLFGAGFAAILERARATGYGGWPVALRRIGFLGLLGVVHGTLLWHGDILTSYAILALVTLPIIVLANRRVILGAAAVAYAAGPIWTAIEVWRSDAAGRLARRHWWDRMYANADQAFAHGRWGAALLARVPLYKSITTQVVTRAAPLLLCMILLGAWAWKRGILRDPAQHRKLLYRLASIGLPAVLLAGLVLGILRDQFGGAHPRWIGAVYSMTLFMVFPLGAVGFLALVLLACRRAALARLLTPLAPLGRMALTCYLLQSVVATLFFNAYGLAHYGRVGSARGAGFAIAIWAAEVAMAWAWLRRFSFGPLEWLWRVAGYARLPTRAVVIADQPARSLDAA
jgi:uncharacterized protein